MTKIQKHIEIVRSITPGLSSMGQKSCDALYALLQKHYSIVGVSLVSTLADLELLVSKKPDLVFMGMKFVPSTQGTKVWVSGYLDRQGINHTGSPQKAIAFEQDKPRAKQRMMEVGIKTSSFIVVRNAQTLSPSTPFEYPLFVKPANLGAGRGVDEKSVVHTRAELDAKISSLKNMYGADALIEKYLSGREFSVGVLRKEHSDELIAMPLELIAGKDVNGDRILSHRLKSGPLETPVYPVTEPILRSQLKNLAVSAFQALGARDYGRIDIRLSAVGTPHFLEANLIPCIIENSGNFPKSCVMNQNLQYEDMILQIVALALEREDSQLPNVEGLSTLFTSSVRVL